MRKGLEEKLRALVGRYSKVLFSDCYIECGYLHIAEPLVRYQHGESNADIFDLASLTKPLVTTPLILLALAKMNLPVTAKVAAFDRPSMLADLPPQFSNLSFESLLSHTSGLVAWRNFFTLCQSESEQGILPANSPEERWRLVAKVLQRKEVFQGEKPVEAYSDLGFIFLGCLLEQHHKKPLSEIFASFLKAKEFAKKSLSTLSFLPQEKHRVVASSQDRAPGGALRGVVHDENAAALGGVAGHAGLFGRGEDLGFYLRALFTENETGRKLLAVNQKAMDSKEPKFLGLRRGDDPAAFPFGKGQTLGHYGFTGTSFWLEPTSLRYYLLLTNRTISGRLNPLMRAFRQEVSENLAASWPT